MELQQLIRITVHFRYAQTDRIPRLLAVKIIIPLSVHVGNRNDLIALLKRRRVNIPLQDEFIKLFDQSVFITIYVIFDPIRAVLLPQADPPVPPDKIMIRILVIKKGIPLF